MTTKQSQEIVKLLETINLDIWADDIKDIETSEDLRDFLEDNSYFDVEIIYYSRALDYLRENDPSLQLSVGIAIEYGCAIENITSELLASLLASQKIREDYYELESELEEILDK